YRPPLVDFSLVEGSQSLRRLLLARHNLVTQVHEPLAGRWSRQSLDNRCVELADDVLRRALWSPNCTPDRSVEPGESSTVPRPGVRCRCRAAPAGERIGFDAARTHLRQRGGEIGDNQVDLTGHQILHCRGTAAVMHKVNAGAGSVLEKNAEDM